MDRTIELGVLLDRVGAQRRVIFWTTLLSALTVGVIAWFMPPWYRAQASLLPPSEGDSGFGFASMLKGIGVPGIKVPTEAAPADVFVAVLESRRIGGEIVRRFNLQAIYKKRLMTDALREFHSHSKFWVTEAGTIQIEVEDRDPKRAADMANACFGLLDEFNREVRMTKGRRARLFVEQRLRETRDTLAVAEQRLANYEATHKAVALTPEMSSALEASSRFYAERVALQVRLGVIRGYTRGTTDEERQLLQQLAELERQLGTLPGTGLGLTRLIRDVKTFEQLYFLLTGQYEEARIMEARDVATVDQIDVASPPERKSRPKRGLMVLAAFLLSFSAGILFALTRPTGSDEPVVRGRVSD